MTASTTARVFGTSITPAANAAAVAGKRASSTASCSRDPAAGRDSRNAAATSSTAYSLICGTRGSPRSACPPGPTST